MTRWGGIVLAYVNTLDSKTIGKKGDAVNNAFRAMIAGAKRIADEQAAVLLKGETAELSSRVASPNPTALAVYLWSGVAIGAYNPATIITGDKVAEGMLVMALRERGFRNNGISSVIVALEKRFGPNWATNPEATEAVKQAAAPAVIYDRFLATANGWFDWKFRPEVQAFLVVHVTGGAIKSKLFEDILLPRGLSAELDDLWEPPDIMRQCAEWRGMTDAECYETWHGGQGVLAVINETDESRFVNMASRRFGIQARCAGRITKEDKPTLVIKSKFNGDTIRWPKE